MPITIGTRPESDYGDPLGLLSGCHRRIERFLDLLGGLLRTPPEGAPAYAPQFGGELRQYAGVPEQGALQPRLVCRRAEPGKLGMG